jgi:hypothetical protein
LNKRVLHNVCLILAMTTLGLLGERSRAQLQGPKYDERLLFRGLTGITMGGWQQEWKLKDEGNVVEESAPVSLSVPLSNRILISVANAPAVSTLDSMKLQGITDTRLGFSYVVPGDKVWINGGASLPTGVTKLTQNELSVATILSETAFDYRVPVFGQGTNANLGLAYAYAAQRRLILGFGASYVYKGEYQPASITGFSEKYDPGDEVSVNAGLDYTTFSKSERLSLDLTVTNYLPDKLDGQNFIQSGLRLMTLAVYSLKWGPITHQFQFRTRLRTQSRLYSSGVAESYKSSQHYEVQYTASWLPERWCSLSWILQGKYHTGDQIPFGVGIYETGKAQLASVGGEVGFTLASWFGLSFDAKYGVGSVVIENVKNNVTGIEFGGSGRVQF